MSRSDEIGYGGKIESVEERHERLHRGVPFGDCGICRRDHPGLFDSAPRPETGEAIDPEAQECGVCGRSDGRHFESLHAGALLVWHPAPPSSAPGGAEAFRSAACSGSDAPHSAECAGDDCVCSCHDSCDCAKCNASRSSRDGEGERAFDVSGCAEDVYHALFMHGPVTKLYATNLLEQAFRRCYAVGIESERAKSVEAECESARSRREERAYLEQDITTLRAALERSEREREEYRKTGLGVAVLLNEKLAAAERARDAAEKRVGELEGALHDTRLRLYSLQQAVLEWADDCPYTGLNADNDLRAEADSFRPALAPDAHDGGEGE